MDVLKINDDDDDDDDDDIPFVELSLIVESGELETSILRLNRARDQELYFLELFGCCIIIKLSTTQITIQIMR